MWSFDLPSMCFWIAATLNVVASFTFIWQIRNIPKTVLSERHFSAARGQRKDNWLLSGIIWTGIILRESNEETAVFFFLTIPLLIWLLQRTLFRTKVTLV